MLNSSKTSTRCAPLSLSFGQIVTLKKYQFAILPKQMLIIPRKTSKMTEWLGNWLWCQGLNQVIQELWCQGRQKCNQWQKKILVAAEIPTQQSNWLLGDWLWLRAARFDFQILMMKTSGEKDDDHPSIHLNWWIGGNTDLTVSGWLCYQKLLEAVKQSAY